MCKLKTFYYATTYAAIAALVTSLFSVAPGHASALPDNAKPASVATVKAIYSGRTWSWKKGAGYFRRDGKFFAWIGSGSGDKSSYAEGAWAVYKGGKLCFSAQWHGTYFITWGGLYQYVSGGVACFAHKTASGNIYQKRLGSSQKWYIFRHAKIRKNNEASKVRPGDRVTEKYREYRGRLEAKFAPESKHRRRVRQRRYEKAKPTNIRRSLREARVSRNRWHHRRR